MIPAGHATASGDFAALRAGRERIARDLAGPIASCVARKDTAHPAFHGCVDWHSSVHGTWALLAYSGATGDAQFDPLVRAALSETRLAKERAHLAREPLFEMPYGRAWFLRLVRDHEETSRGDLRLRAFGDEVAARLLRHYTDGLTDPDSRDYDSAAWALVNLHEYAVHRNDAVARSRIEALVRQSFAPAAGRCFESVAPERGFMAVCTTWAWLVSRVLPRRAFIEWVREFMPPESIPAPLARAASAHQNGLNFSRASGLWQVFAATGNTAYRDHYVAHVTSSYRRRNSWDGDYRQVGHWVAQFGMLAILPLFAEPPLPASN